jgi:hypothetical protein
MGATAMYDGRFLENAGHNNSAYNPAYQAEIHELRDTWAFIRLNGERSEGQGIVAARDFGHVWDEDGYRKIPKQLFDDWLSDFSLPSLSP